MFKFKTVSSHTFLPAKSEQVYLVRDDSMFYGGVSDEEKQRFVDTLQKYVPCPVVMFRADEQIKFVENNIAKICKDYRYDYVISLDKWYKGDFQLKISRNFDSDNQAANDKFIVENYKELNAFLMGKSNERLSYLIVDDDISTGATIEYVKGIIQRKISSKVIDCYDMSKSFKPQGDREIYDIVDLRDFIPGAKFGGLMVNGVRKLYKHPEVDLVSRMKLNSVEDAINFTKDWCQDRKVEIGHFYCDQKFEDISLDYLDNFKFKSQDELILFIDDFSTDKRVLDVEALRQSAENKLKSKVKIVYESEMAEYAEKTMDYLCGRFVVKDLPEATLNGIKLKRNNKPTCFLLSLTWTLFRAGYFENKEVKVLTIIDRKYQKLESNVYKYSPENVKKLLEYIFI